MSFMKSKLAAALNMLLLAAVYLAPLAAAAPEAAAPAGEEPAAPKPQGGFYTIIFGGGAVGVICWLLLFSCSAVMVALIIDGHLTLKKDIIMPPALQVAVKNAMDQGDLQAAITACEGTKCPLSHILLAGFNNISEGFEAVMDSIHNASDLESEKLLQRINYLNLCGAMGPMLGLLGTVTGMVGCFSSLASATGAAKQSELAMNISVALWTTIVGLLISIPATLWFTLFRNSVNKMLLQMESLTTDLVKVLKNAEVVDGGEAAE